MTTLKELEEALREPFSVEDIQFKPKTPREKQDKSWECLALPYTDKRIYEDRLNALAYGEWATPYTPPVVAGNKLIVPVTVVICGIAHTDFGEAFLESTNRNGEKRQEENSATEAYSQGFRRACAQFGLGRYLYGLPYNKVSRTIIAGKGEKTAWVEKLYMQVGLSPRQKHALSSPRLKVEAKTAAATETPVAKVQKQSNQSPHPTAPIVDEDLLHWLERTLTNEQTQALYTRYGIRNLAELTHEQADRAAQRLIELQQPTKR